MRRTIRGQQPSDRFVDTAKWMGKRLTMLNLNVKYVDMPEMRKTGGFFDF